MGEFVLGRKWQGGGQRQGLFEEDIRELSEKAGVRQVMPRFLASAAE